MWVDQKLIVCSINDKVHIKLITYNHFYETNLAQSMRYESLSVHIP